MSNIVPCQSGPPISILIFSNKPVKWGWRPVWSDHHLSRQSSREHVWLLPFPWWVWRFRPYTFIGCTVFMDGGHTLFHIEAPPSLGFGDKQSAVYTVTMRSGELPFSWGVWSLNLLCLLWFSLPSLALCPVKSRSVCGIVVTQTL